MIHRASADFWTDYQRLPAWVRSRADKQFSRLKENPQHPSLHFKKLGVRNGQQIWSARVTLPKDMLAGRQAEIHAQRDRKLEEARKQRQIRRQKAA
ncbi:MAG: hypothetical protein R2762_30965 [Bryobacteraceae bacterium]